ncbi:MAG: acetyl-CoA carboxylase biotin carboxyl carrier protein [Saprospiraceae bacterium]|nr:acetyl-CoA carboxylase biotin carboxyl carrier protein [Saprospiraceae bacterium]MCB9324754.1 acetyl-CoA carboxylase biotin carboxyl carrier protein [Lewinellaceae bacterium]
MTFKEIQELIKQLSKSNLSEFKLRDGDFEISVRTKHFNKQNAKAQLISSQAIMPSAPALSAAPVAAPARPSGDTTGEAAATQNQMDGNYLEVKSPMVGTFYRSPSPDKPPYVKVGDSIEKGSAVCIIEAMKLFNEIESEIGGKIVKVMVEDAQPVEYDQVLFLVDPS